MLTLMYGVSVSGMTLHIHYCCGKVDKIDFVPVKNDNCPDGNKLTKKGCCDDQQVELKIKTDYKGEMVLCSPDRDYSVPVDFLLLYSAGSIGKTLPVYFNNGSPPLGRSLPLYIIHCIYRI